MYGAAGSRGQRGAAPCIRGEGTRGTEACNHPEFAASPVKQHAPQTPRTPRCTRLNLGDQAAHHARQDACSPAPRRHRIHAQAGRQRMAYRRRAADGNAPQLSGPKRHAHVGAGRPRLLVLDSVETAGQMQARCGGLDEVEWGVDLRGLGGQHAAAHARGEERVLILNDLWWHRGGYGTREGRGLHR
jgi:hypothetical protein